MKNINKKAIAVSLALIMITSMFTACKKTNAVTEDGTSKENLQGSVSTESNAETSDRTDSAGETEMSSEKSFSDAEESGEIKSETEGTTKKALVVVSFAVELTDTVSFSLDSAKELVILGSD